ncbi:hypothetical protein VNO77_17001 [Canavalia gladiata]|uniref:Uncharacterized protein n=1 Tax=Canavalia gladiata TaxID=3824 RepID=A0AAN9LLR3_CANGL
MQKLSVGVKYVEHFRGCYARAAASEIIRARHQHDHTWHAGKGADRCDDVIRGSYADVILLKLATELSRDGLALHQSLSQFPSLLARLCNQLCYSFFMDI